MNAARARVNPPYRYSNQGNSSSVIFRHSSQFFRGYYSRDAWTAEVIFSKLPEKKWRKLRFICFGFVSCQRCFLHSQPPFVWPGFRLFFWLFGCSLFWHLYGFGGVKISKLSFNCNGNEYNGCVSVRYNSLFNSLPLFTDVHKTTTRNSYILHISEKVNYATANC